jgi:hypothetical protein
MVLGLVLLAVGAIMLATAIARSRSFRTWAGITFPVGLALWCPLLPPAVRVADGLLIGIGTGREMAATEPNWRRPDPFRLPNGQLIGPGCVRSPGGCVRSPGTDVFPKQSGRVRVSASLASGHLTASCPWVMARVTRRTRRRALQHLPSGDVYDAQ